MAELEPAKTEEDASPYTEDGLLGGRLALRQPRVGYRAGLDAALLAAALQARPGERAIEAGCGAGAALLQAAWRWPDVQFVGLERDELALALAQANVARNGLQDRASAVAGDVDHGFRALGLGAFDIAFANPPFFDDPAALRGPHPARRGAYIADGGLRAWTGFLLQAVRDGGRVVLIHRTDRLADLLDLLGQGGGGGFRIRPVQPFSDAPAKRVLVQAIRGGRSPLVLLPALVLHERGAAAKHAPQAEAILRGEAALAWA